MTPVQLPEVPAQRDCVAFRWEGDPINEASDAPWKYASHWSTPPWNHRPVECLYTAAQLRAYATEYGDAILAKVRTAIADYMHSEGCSCCRGGDHDEHEAIIAGLLGVAPYSDNSGFDFAPYRTGATQQEQNSER